MPTSLICRVQHACVRVILRVATPKQLCMVFPVILALGVSVHMRNAAVLYCRYDCVLGAGLIVWTVVTSTCHHLRIPSVFCENSAYLIAYTRICAPDAPHLGINRESGAFGRVSTFTCTFCCHSYRRHLAPQHTFPNEGWKAMRGTSPPRDKLTWENFVK